MTRIEASSYTIEIGDIDQSSFKKLLNGKYKNAKKVILVDENTHDYCLEYLITNFDDLREAEVMLLPVGEPNKVMEVCFQVWDAMSEYEVGRNDLIINMGGGMVTDMGGFIASVYKRGMDFINIPTTLLGMIDASIGGKTGIDLGHFKNQIGTFANPIALYIDPAFLMTLPQKEVLNGYAEMLKHGLIIDSAYWRKLKNLTSFDKLISKELIEPSVRIKNEIVLRDPKEGGERKKLNFGHTVGHAIEGYYLNKLELSHGHAIAIGILAESFISFKRQMISEEEWFEIEGLIRSAFPMIDIESSDVNGIIGLMKNDKKNFDGKIQCTLLTGIGESVVNKVVSEIEFKESLTYLVELEKTV